MTLRLTDVVGLSLDAAAAKLKTGTITIFTDRGTRFEIKNLARGTQVLERGHRVAAANRHGVVSVNLHSGKTVLMLVAAAATHPAPPPRQRPAPAPSFTG
jgi:ferric-dicitrate binding protein FerR (iron transport regulator)